MKKYITSICIMLFIVLFSSFALGEGHTHDYSINVFVYDAINPCTKPYVSKMICSCGAEDPSATKVITTPLGHNLDLDNPVVIIRATCNTTGRNEAQCTRCKQWVEYETGVNESHIWTEWENASVATCVHDGLQERICTRCEKIEMSVVPATGIHQFSLSLATLTTRASCIEAGYYTAQCLLCGETFSGQGAETATDGTQALVIAPRGHKYDDGKVIKQVTCKEDGQVDYTCLNTTSTDKYIGCTYVSHTIIPHEEIEYRKEYQGETSKYHKWTDVVEIAATKTNPGIHHYVCETCGLVGPSQAIKKVSSSTSSSTHPSTAVTNSNGITVPATGDDSSSFWPIFGVCLGIVGIGGLAITYKHKDE